MAISNDERENRAKQYDAFISQHDVLTRKVSELQSKFDLNESDNKEIKTIQAEMALIQRKAQKLGDYFG